MYNELYAAWRREIEETSLGSLPPDFYTRLGEYLRHINEENALDKKSFKVNLLEHEAQNVKRMLEELLETRYKKIVQTVTQTQKIPTELLTVEEAKMTENFAAFTGAYQKFTNELMQGQATQTVQAGPITVKVITEKPAESGQKRLVLRFIKSIPAIMGFDMKSYGPFKAEDVASVPAENAKILVKQGLAVLVEAS